MNSLPRQRDDVTMQRVEGGAVLLREDGEYIVLNPVGTLIWETLDSAGGLDGLVDRLAAIPGSPERDTCRHQALQFLKQLLDAGFVQEVP